MTAALGQQHTFANQAMHFLLVSRTRLSRTQLLGAKVRNVDELIPVVNVVLAVAQVFVRGLNVGHTERRGEGDEQLGSEHGRSPGLFGDLALKLCEAFGIHREVRELLRPPMHRLPRGLGWRSEVIRPGAVLVDALAIPVVLVLKHIIVMNHERKDLATEPAGEVARDAGIDPMKDGINPGPTPCAGPSQNRSLRLADRSSRTSRSVS